MIGAITATSGASSPVDHTTPLETPRQDPIFNQEQCLFCNKLFGTFEANVAHMQTAHGLFVPDRKRLIVDLETLFAYLHLVIVGHNECICCGTQRSSTLAVQQRKRNLTRPRRPVFNTRLRNTRMAYTDT